MGFSRYCMMGQSQYLFIVGVEIPGSLRVQLCGLAVADPGFPVGGAELVGGRQLPRRLCFKKFVCQNERIWTLRGGMHQRRPLDLPMLGYT